MPSGTGTAFGDPLFPTAGKVGKRAGRNQWFLHFLARYTFYRIVTASHTFTWNFLFCIVKRIVSAPVPLPLIPTPNNASVSTAVPHERQRRKKNVDASYKTITDMFCEREGKATKLKMRYSVRGFLNRRFKLSFWVLLGRGVKKTCRWHVFSLRSRRLCRRSIHLVFEGTIVHRAGRRGRRPLRSLHRTPTTNCNIKGDNYHAYSGY